MTARKAKEKEARGGARAKAKENEKARVRANPQSATVMAKTAVKAMPRSTRKAVASGDKGLVFIVFVTVIR